MSSLTSYSVPRVAAIFGVSPVTVRRWIYSDRCPGQQTGDGGHWRVPASWVRSEMDKLRPKPTRPKRRIVEME